MKKKLCVWNLSPETTCDDLHSLFAQISRVISIEIPTLAHVGRSMEWGFVEIETGNLKSVIDKVGITELDGRTLHVHVSSPEASTLRSGGEARLE
jgi:RNA recognition motif-containing protein